MTAATLAKRLEKLEAVRRAADQERHDVAMRQLGRTMSAEHIRYVQDWLREHGGGTKAQVALPGESPYATFQRLRPPALVRAVWLLMDAHVRTGCPVALPPAVAEVYLGDERAYPATPCDGCGYLLPFHGDLQPDSTFRNVGYYLGSCPVCGLDNHPQEDATL